MQCLSNLRQVALAFKTWSLDGDEFPAAAPIQRRGAKEAAEAGQVFSVFKVVSNELTSPKRLVCPLDKQRTAATNFGPQFSDNNISYFLGLEAGDAVPYAFLSGDRNLASRTGALGHGVFPVSTNTWLNWTKDIHRSRGNVALSDGSVRMLDQTNLLKAIQGQGIQTNRLAIP